MKKVYWIPLLIVAIVGSITWVNEITPRLAQEEKGEAAIPITKNQWVEISTGVGDDFRDFQFLDEDHGWAVTNYKLWKTDNGGQTWMEIKSTNKINLLEHLETQETLEKIQFLNLSEGWVLEGDHFIHTTDSGSSWRKQQLKNVIVRSFQFLDINNGWLVGQLLRSPARKGEVETWHPVIYNTKDGGRNWRCMYTGPNGRYPLWDVWPISSTNIWAVGVSILHSEDGGTTWNKIDIKDRKGVSGMPSQVQFLDANTGWITTNEAGGYLFTNNGGITWEPRPAPANTDFIEGVMYINSAQAWVAAGYIYESTNTGQSWVQLVQGDYSRIQYLRSRNILFAAGKGIAKYKLP